MYSNYNYTTKTVGYSICNQDPNTALVGVVPANVSDNVMTQISNQQAQSTQGKSLKIKTHRPCTRILALKQAIHCAYLLLLWKVTFQILKGRCQSQAPWPAVSDVRSKWHVHMHCSWCVKFNSLLALLQIYTATLTKLPIVLTKLVWRSWCKVVRRRHWSSFQLSSSQQLLRAPADFQWWTRHHILQWTRSLGTKRLLGEHHTSLVDQKISSAMHCHTLLSFVLTSFTADCQHCWMRQCPQHRMSYIIRKSLQLSHCLWVWLIVDCALRWWFQSHELLWWTLYAVGFFIALSCILGTNGSCILRHKTICVLF